MWLDILIAILSTIMAAEGFAKHENMWGTLFAANVLISIIVINKKLKLQDNETIPPNKK